MPPARQPYADATIELGTTGARKTGTKGLGGWYDEEFHRDLRTSRDRMRVYTQMCSNDAPLGVCENLSLSLLRRLDWKWVRPDDKPESKKWQEFAEGMTTDMRRPLGDIITEAYSFKRFGWSAAEKVLKQRTGEKRTAQGAKDRLRSSLFTDGKWGIADVAPRKQTSIEKWQWDGEENLIAMVQAARLGAGKKAQPIPYGKLLHLKTMPNADDPEGWSPLRWLYRAWRIKKGIEDNESVGVQKEATGALVGRAPSKILNATQGDDLTAKLAMMNSLGGFNNNELSFFMWPSDSDDKGNKFYDLLPVPSAGARGYNTHEIIQRYDRWLISMWNMQFLAFGGQGKGSQALSLDTTDMAEQSVESYADIVEDGLEQQLFVDVWDANNVPEEYRPRCEHGAIARKDLAKFFEVIGSLTDKTILTADRSLEDFARDELGLPDADEVEEDVDDTIPHLDDPEDLPPEPMPEPEPEPEPEPRAKRRDRIRRSLRRVAA